MSEVSRGKLHVVAEDLGEPADVVGQVLEDVYAGFDRLLSSHAAFAQFLVERDAASGDRGASAAADTQ